MGGGCMWCGQGESTHHMMGWVSGATEGLGSGVDCGGSGYRVEACVPGKDACAHVLDPGSWGPSGDAHERHEGNNA